STRCCSAATSDEGQRPAGCAARAGAARVLRARRTARHAWRARRHRARPRHRIRRSRPGNADANRLLRARRRRGEGGRRRRAARRAREAQARVARDASHDLDQEPTTMSLNMIATPPRDEPNTTLDYETFVAGIATIDWTPQRRPPADIGSMQRPSWLAR